MLSLTFRPESRKLGITRKMKCMAAPGILLRRYTPRLSTVPSPHFKDYLTFYLETCRKSLSNLSRSNIALERCCKNLAPFPLFRRRSCLPPSPATQNTRATAAANPRRAKSTPPWPPFSPTAHPIGPMAWTCAATARPTARRATPQPPAGSTGRPPRPPVVTPRRGTSSPPPWTRRAPVARARRTATASRPSRRARWSTTQSTAGPPGGKAAAAAAAAAAPRQ